MKKVGSKKALGRGLDALIPKVPPQAPPGSRHTCGIEEIIPNPRQPRKAFQSPGMDELAASIREKGIIQPLIVRKSEDNTGARFELVAGERRWRAAQKAGLHQVPIIVKDITDGESLEIALIENIQREDLNPVEEALALKSLMDDFKLTQEALSSRLGKERSTIANSLRLLRLPPRVTAELENGTISRGHALSLLALDDPELILKALSEVLSKELSVRGTEKLTKRISKSQPKPKRIDPNIKKLESDLSVRLGAKVKITTRGKGGRLEISFANNEELDRILRTILK